MSVQLRSILAGGFLLLSGAIACAVDPEPPAATGYKVLPVPENWRSKKDLPKVKPILDNVNKIMNSGGSISGYEGPFEKYFTLVVFPQWTQTTEENLNKLPKSRDVFLRSLENSSKNPPAHTLLVDVTHRELSKIAQDPEFHPAVRYNAILVVGLLNETEPSRTSAKQAPEPYSKALPTLMAELKKPDNNEAVRVGALMGVARHLEWDNAKPAGAANKIPPPLRGEVLAELTSIVSTKAPPTGRSPEGQTWLRRRALEALGNAFAQQLDASFAKLLDDIITNDSEPISLRCTAAEVMSRMDYKAPVVLAVVPAAKNLGYLALYACHTELLRLENLKKKDEELAKVAGGITGGGMGMPGGGGMGMPGMAGGAGMGMAGGAGMGMPGGAGPGMMPSGGGMPGMPGMPGRSGAGGGKKGSRMPGMPGMDALTNDPKAYRINYSKRRLRAELYAVQLALGKKKKGAVDENARGLIAFAKAETDTKGVETITKQVEDVIREVETPDQDAVTYEKNLRAEMKKLEKLTKLLPAVVKTDAAKPAAAAEEEVPGAAKAPAAKAPAAKAPVAEEPAEEVPMAPAAKGPAGPAKAAPADAGKGTPADAGKAAPADAGKAPAAGKMP
jgi:hypothetical protein